MQPCLQLPYCRMLTLHSAAPRHNALSLIGHIPAATGFECSSRSQARLPAPACLPHPPHPPRAWRAPNGKVVDSNDPLRPAGRVMQRVAATGRVSCRRLASTATRGGGGGDETIRSQTKSHPPDTSRDLVKPRNKNAVTHLRGRKLRLRAGPLLQQRNSRCNNKV